MLFSRFKFHKLIIFIPAVFACLIDLTVTAINQRPDYWLNNLNKVNELNPILHWAMKNHILGLFIVTLIWLVLISLICLLTPVTIGRFISLAIVLGNSWGAGTWISRFYGFWFVILLVAVNSLLFLICDDIQRRYSR